MICQHSGAVEREKGPFPYDSGYDDAPVLLDYITRCSACGSIVGVEPNTLGSFGMGWDHSKWWATARKTPAPSMLSADTSARPPISSLREE
jgi:hypothetical protein